MTALVLPLVLEVVQVAQAARAVVPEVALVVVLEVVLGAAQVAQDVQAHALGQVHEDSITKNNTSIN